MTMTVSRKFVPQRTCAVENCCAVSGVSSTPFSYAAIDLCSAPWYWNTRRMSPRHPITSRYTTNSASRAMPSTIGNEPWNRCAERVAGERGQHDEERAEHDHRDADRPAERLLRDLLLFGGTCWFADHVERLVAEAERFAETHHAAHDRDVAVALGPARHVADVDLDLAVGVAHRDRPRATRRASSRLRAPPGRPCSGARAGRSTATALLLLGLRGPALEALDAATGVDELLLARVEGVALRAELDAQRWDGRTGRELVPAGTVHLALDVIGVNVGLHDLVQSNGARVSAAQPRSGQVPIPDGALAISVEELACCSSCCGACRSAARGPEPPSSALSTRRSFQTCWRSCRSNSSSSCRVLDCSTSIAG